MPKTIQANSLGCTWWSQIIFKKDKTSNTNIKLSQQIMT